MAGAALIVMLFFVLSRVTGLAREIVIGAQFGTSAQLDAYLAAFRVPDILFQLVAGGALGSAFIPTFATYWVRGAQREAWLLFSRVLNLATLVLILLAGLAALFALPLVQHIIAPGFTPEQQQLSAHLMRWMLVSTVIFGASGLVMGALNAVHHFLLPAVAPVFYNLSIIAGAWLLAPHLGVYGLVIGVTIGACGHLLVQLPGLLRHGAIYQWSFSTTDAGVREVARLMGPRVLGLFFVQMHFLVNTILASGLSTGSVSALNYAWLIMLLPQGVFAQAISTAAFPTFAAQVAAGHHAAMRQTFGSTLRMIFFLTIPAAVAMYVLRTPLVQLLLQRREFDQQSTQMVAFALQFYVIGLVAHAALEIVVRAFYALHDTWTPVVIGVAAMSLNVLLSIWWVKGLAFGGLALANSVATTLEMLLLLVLLRSRLHGIDAQRLLWSVGRFALAAAGMGVGGWLWVQWLGGQSVLPRTAWFVASSSTILCILLYLALSILARSEELGLLQTRLLTAIGGRFRH